MLLMLLHYWGGPNSEVLGIADQEILLSCLCFFGERSGGEERGELQGPAALLSVFIRGQNGDRIKRDIREGNG